MPNVPIPQRVGQEVLAVASLGSKTMAKPDNVRSCSIFLFRDY